MTLLKGGLAREQDGRDVRPRIVCTFFAFRGAPLSPTFSGNLRVELDGSPMCDVNLEHSYLVYFHFPCCYHNQSLLQIDFSKDLIAWVKSEKYALVDVNLFPRPFATQPLATSLVGSTG